MSVISWLGNAEYGVAGNRVQEGNPVVFRPNDISGLQVWLDANNGNAVYANGFGTVESWFNQGDLSGNFDLSGTADVRYGDNRVNGLNVVTFNANAYMTGQFAMNFQDRSLFIVSRRNTPIDTSGVFTWLTGDTSGEIESGIVYDLSSNTYTYLISKHPGFSVEVAFDTQTDTTGYPELATFINSSTDLSANYVGLNGASQVLTANNLASGYYTSNAPYFIGNYFGGVTIGNDYDLCEVVMYDTALDATQRALVEEYLIAKWAVTSPPAPPFNPQSISGLRVWLDASNGVDVSGSAVLSWQNLGDVSGSYIPGSNVASYSNGFVDFPSETTLETYAQLPYYSRTFFCVFEPKSDLTTIAYPYLNLNVGDATDGRQIGVTWDSNVSSFYVSVCQNGTNCPISGVVTLNSGLNLYTGVVDSNSYTTTYAYMNNGSNVNISTDLGNQFNQNPIPYSIGSSVTDSPAFAMAEFLEYDSVLTSGQISTVTAYLSQKWNLGF